MNAVLARLAGFLRPHAAVLCAVLLATGAFALLDAAAYVLLIPFVESLFVSGGADPTRGTGPMARALDVTVYRWVEPSGDPLAAVNRIVALLVLVFLLKNLALFARTYLSARLEQGVGRDLRNAAYDRVLALDPGFFGRVRTGQVVSRLTTEIEQVRTLVTAEAARLVSALVEVAVALAAMLLLSWKLTAAALVVVPGTMAVWGPMVRGLRRRDRGALRLGAELHGRIQETVDGIRLVRAASQEERERTRFRGMSAAYMDRVLRAERARAWAPPATEMLAATGTALLLWFGARLVVGGELAGAELVGFLGLSLKLYRPVKQVARFPATAQPGLVAAERVFELLDTPARVVEDADPVAKDDFRHEIAFEDVHFAYRPDQPVLRGLSFRLCKGSVVAVVGASGGGKSTVVDLLTRFHDVDSGRITVDGVDIRRMRLGDLRSWVGVVPQDPFMLHDTVWANLAYGAPEADERAVLTAARAARVDRFVAEFADGYRTVVGSRGVELSGGQRQRLAIARTLLRDSPILLLDEATSALDPESDRSVGEMLRDLGRTRTVLVVAHRLSTVMRADRILVLDGGRIVEDGTHWDLLERDGVYRRLYEAERTGGAVPVP